MVEALAPVPGTLLVLGVLLQVAAGQIDAHAITEDMIERGLARDIGAAFGDGRHQFDFMLQVLGLGRVGNGGAVGHQRVARLAEEEGQLTVGIGAHLAGMIGIIAANAENPPHGKQSRIAGDRNGWLPAAARLCRHRSQAFFPRCCAAA